MKVGPVSRTLRAGRCSLIGVVTCPKCGTEMTEGSTNAWVQTGPRHAVKVPNSPKAMICEKCGYVEFWLKR